MGRSDSPQARDNYGVELKSVGKRRRPFTTTADRRSTQWSLQSSVRWALRSAMKGYPSLRADYTVRGKGENRLECFHRRLSMGAKDTVYRSGIKSRPKRLQDVLTEPHIGVLGRVLLDLGRVQPAPSVWSHYAVDMQRQVKSLRMRRRRQGRRHRICSAISLVAKNRVAGLRPE